jgi:hypothetical protein
MSSGYSRVKARREAANVKNINKRMNQLKIINNLDKIPCIRYTVINLRGVF